jgi:hypothetical protein
MQFQPGPMNIRNKPLVHPKKILLPPLHMKFGVKKDSVKAMDYDGKAFQYLQLKFPQISDPKSKTKSSLVLKLGIL